MYHLTKKECDVHCIALDKYSRPTALLGTTAQRCIYEWLNLVLILTVIVKNYDPKLVIIDK